MTPSTKADLLEQLYAVQVGLTNTVQPLSDDVFDRGTDDSWSAASYLKHLILSVKPFTKALRFPPERLHEMFGDPAHSSRRYEDLVAAYKARLAEGIRAEDFEAVTPVFYRFPDGIEDVKAYLLQVWNETNSQLLQHLQAWSEDDLDRHQLPHPAIGLVTVREMFFFTLYHNTLHWNDIQQAVAV